MNNAIRDRPALVTTLMNNAIRDHPGLISSKSPPSAPSASSKVQVDSISTQSTVSKFFFDFFLTTDSSSPATVTSTPSSVDDYILFFSYAQTDSAMETVLFYGRAAQRYPAKRIFHHSNNAFKLDELVLHVQRAKNVVVFWSPNYCRSSYTLVELHSAMRAGANIYLFIVEKEKPGSASFDFATLAADIKSRKIVRYLDASGWELLKDNGITVDDICADLKKLMNVRVHKFPINQPTSVQNAVFDVIFDLID